MINETLRLSVGGSRGQRVVGGVVGLVFAAVGTVFVLLPLAAAGVLNRLLHGDGCGYQATSGDISDFPPDLLPDCDSGIGGFSTIGLLGLCGVPFALLGLYLALRALRGAAWLAGTKVTVRGALFARTVDLATAEITPRVTSYRRDPDDAFAGTARAVSIVAQDPGNRRSVTIPLQGAGSSLLPPHELRALAAALTVGRSTDGRDGDVHTLAAQLVAMAANPLGL